MSKIDRLRIDSPCTADWNKMKGNDRIRYCEECNRHVYDFSLLPRRQVEAMIASSRGRVCARIEYDDFERPLFLDSPAPVQIQSRRLTPIASAVVTAMLS